MFLSNNKSSPNDYFEVRDMNWGKKRQEKGRKERRGKRSEEKRRVRQWCAERKQGHCQGYVLRQRHRKQPSLLHHRSPSGRHKSRGGRVRDQILVIFVKEKKDKPFCLFIELRLTETKPECEVNINYSP